MALTHIIRHYENENTDKFSWIEPNIFDPADEDRVKLARKQYKLLLGARHFDQNQGKATFIAPFWWTLLGISGGLVTSGMLAHLLNASESSKLWLTAHHSFRPFLDHYPGLFAALSAEMGGLLALSEIIHGREKKYEGKKIIARWDREKFSNNELIHIFKHNENNPRYASEDLYWFTDKWLPDSAKEFVVVGKERKQLDWSRFKRDGDFGLYLGERYEQKGQFNSTPRGVRIPPSGLWTGIACFGPTGKGKSEAFAKPLFDQALGYYHWVDSERDTWLYDIAVSISKLREEAEEAGGARAQEIQARIAQLEEEATRRLQEMEEGKDASLGYEKCGVISIEPKDETWATQLKLCKRFGREKDYIELGVVAEKYQAYQTMLTKLQDSTRVLWSYVPNAAITDSAVKWMLGFSYRNGILHQEKVVDLWVTVDHRDVRLQIQPRSTRSLSEVYPILNGVYGESSVDGSWAQDAFGRANAARRAGLEMLGSIRQDDQGGVEEDYFSLMTTKAVGNPAPFSIAPLVSQNRQFGVLPFGFGIVNDPWFRSSMAQAGRQSKDTVDATLSQRLVLEPFQRIVYLLTLIGGQVRFGEVKRDDSRAKFRPLSSLASVVGWSDWTLGVQDSLREAEERIRDLIPGGGGFEERGIGEVILPVPVVNPTSLLTPTVTKGRGGAELPTEEDAVIQALKEALDLMPAEREENKLLRKRVRAVAPPAKRPGERRYDFRKRYALWQAERRKKQFDFADGLLKVLFAPSPALRAVEDALASSEGKQFGAGVLGVLYRACPLGMLDSILRYALHAPGARQVTVEHLRGLGYEFFEGEEEVEGSPSRLEKARVYRAYDAEIYRGLRPSSGLVARLCEESKIGYDPSTGRFKDKISHLKLRRVEDEYRMAAVLSALVTRIGYPEELAEPVAFLKAVLQGSELAKRSKGLNICDEFGSLEWARKVREVLYKADLADKLVYEYEPGIPTSEAISDDPEDLEAVVDCERVGVPLGPWDALWSEGVSERLWPEIQQLARSTMTKAIGLYTEEEVRLARATMPEGTAAGNQRAQVEGALKSRRDDVFAGCMTYLSALENFLKVLAPYYKVNTAFPYGYKDFGGIGDCRGATKFNPLHHPDMTPEQVAAMLVGILARNAGSGDTPFWNDSAKMISEGFLSLLRAGDGYATVQALNQMMVSDSFADLVISKAERRLKRMRESAGGSHSGEVMRQQMVFDLWAKLYGVEEAPELLNEALDLGELPAELQALLPRSASGTEIKTLEGYLRAGRSFLISDWRSDRGSFSEKEIRSTCKLNLLNQLTPVSNGIGAFSFSPEDEDELSFPTPTEMRNLGLCVATRFNYANDKKTGSVVLGMFIAAYQMMVLSAKQRQTQALETFKRITGLRDTRRKQLKELREETRRLRAEMECPKADAEALKAFFQEIHRTLPADLPVPDAAERMVQALWLAEAEGKLKDRKGRSGARVVYESVAGAQFLATQSGLAARFMGRVGGPVDRLQDELRRSLEQAVNQRQEKEYEITDRINRNEGLIWEYRQEVLNALSELEEFPNWSRIMMLLIDEYQFFANTNVKGSVLTDVDFLSTSRAGKSINVLITQAPSSVKSSGMGTDLWEQWISNMLIRVCLGAPNKQDQEYISDLFRGEKVWKEKGKSFSLSFEGVDINRGSGDLRASEVQGGSKNFTLDEEYEKYVSPDDLARMLSMTSWCEWTDGQRSYKPHMLYHPPYFLMDSEAMSRVTGEPLRQKTWLALVRDGELNLNRPNPDEARLMLSDLARVGVDVSKDLAAVEQTETLLKSSKAVA